MKSKQVLLVEQMTHLQELGLDTVQGSMCWCYALSYKNAKWELEIYEDVINQKRDSAFWEIIPTYTLQDILDKLPTLIIISSDFYKICIEPSCGYWDIYYYKSDATELISKKSENIIDAAYDMLCWCIENGYVEKEGK